jgi:hypothetical protein
MIVMLKLLGMQVMKYLLLKNESILQKNQKLSIKNNFILKIVALFPLLRERIQERVILFSLQTENNY